MGDFVSPPVIAHKHTGVLGRQSLRAVWEDIGWTELPSWAGRSPAGVGKAGRGKLKADEWRTLCNVSLVHTLGRLWAGEGERARRRQLLGNYMDLVTATKLATRRNLTLHSIQTCRFYIQRYPRELRNLFPYHHISPNQHLLAHLPDALLDFGPTHAWQCFAFERYNYVLQHINTNHKLGRYLFQT